MRETRLLFSKLFVSCFVRTCMSSEIRSSKKYHESCKKGGWWVVTGADMNFERFPNVGTGGGGQIATQILVIEYRLNFKHIYINNTSEITRYK